MKTENIKIDQFLLGSYLGDGGFTKKSENHNTYIVFKHCEDQYQYLNWKYEIMKKNCFVRDDNKGITEVKIKDGSCFPNHQRQYKFATKSNPDFNFYKTISDDDICEMFDEGAFVVWLLDDGNVYKKTIKIACGSKSRKLINKLVNVINEKFGIDAFYYEHPSRQIKNYIRIPAKCYPIVKELVLKYVPASIDIVMSKFDTEPSKQFKIDVKYFVNQPPLCYIDGKSDWIDLRAAERVELSAGEYCAIPLGIGMILPKGFEAHIEVRSSTFKNWGILKACSGIIDNTYNGNDDQWKFGVYATRDTVIEKYDRICQFRIVENQPKAEFKTVAELKEKSRGGFGSTGVK